MPRLKRAPSPEDRLRNFLSNRIILFTENGVCVCVLQIYMQLMYRISYTFLIYFVPPCHVFYTRRYRNYSTNRHCKMARLLRRRYAARKYPRGIGDQFASG